MTSKHRVNLLDLASAAVACTVTTSRVIRERNEDKNTRLKQDGSFVTDADFAAQGVIVQALHTVSDQIRIVGEESAAEMAQHAPSSDVELFQADLLPRTRAELRMRYGGETPEHWPLSRNAATSAVAVISNLDTNAASDEHDWVVDASRVSVIVDPLDGTKSYAQGDYDCVSILIGIVVDNEPIFGVVGKPFGYTGLDPILDSSCVTVYGGSLVKGVYVAGGEALIPKPIQVDRGLDALPRAVISGSRSQGVVHDFCVHLGTQGLLHPEPMHVNGAGEKSLRVIFQRNNEALWFFPKAGTSRWDVAASDALLRALGGKLTDKYGREMDYSMSREASENVDGVVCCIDKTLHSECIRLFQDGDWMERK
jgi:3'-phosphoadenosine 5'-phosphosulfate (PAPS) 3'-phosphatase